MKQFNITVNGNSYLVDVEELGSSPNVASPVTRVSSPTPIAKPAAVAQTKPSQSAAPKTAAKPTEASGNGITVTAPMPGTILDIKVSVGQNVNKGDVLMILEAMKMENEIMAPESGKVIAIPVAKSASVNTSELLIEIQ